MLSNLTRRMSSLAMHSASVDPVDKSSVRPTIRQPAYAGLVVRAQAGDMSAWAELYRQHYSRIFSRVRYLTGSASITEELVQEVFVQALLHISDYRGKSSFSTWLHGIAFNLVRNHWRSQKSRRKAHQKLLRVQELQSESAVFQPESAACDLQRTQALYEALSSLPDHLRVAFVLRDIEDVSPELAAEELGISPGNLSVRASRARLRIREYLVAHGWVGVG